MDKTIHIKVSYTLDTGITEADRKAMGEDQFKEGCQEIIDEHQDSDEGISSTYEVIPT